MLTPFLMECVSTTCLLFNLLFLFLEYLPNPYASSSWQIKELHNDDDDDDGNLFWKNKAKKIWFFSLKKIITMKLQLIFKLEAFEMQK